MCEGDGSVHMLSTFWLLVVVASLETCGAQAISMAMTARGREGRG